MVSHSSAAALQQTMIGCDTAGGNSHVRPNGLKWQHPYPPERIKILHLYYTVEGMCSKI